MATREKRREAIKKAMAELEAEAKAKHGKKEAERRAKSKKTGRKYKPHKNKDSNPKDKAQRNFTDPESRIMPSPDKAFIQAFNAQVTVDAETHIIVAVDLTNQAADTVHLPEQIKQVQHNTGRKPKVCTADAGYYSADNLDVLSENKIEALTPPDKIRHSRWRGQKPMRGPIPEDATPKYLMRRKLRSKSGRKRYTLRQTSVEPVFGYIKEQLGLRQFLVRGIEKACSHWRLTCAVHNLMKIFRSGIRLKRTTDGFWAMFPPGLA